MILQDVPDFPVWVEQWIKDNGYRTDYRFTDVPREREGGEQYRRSKARIDGAAKYKRVRA